MIWFIELGQPLVEKVVYVATEACIWIDVRSHSIAIIDIIGTLSMCTPSQTKIRLGNTCGNGCLFYGAIEVCIWTDVGLKDIW